MKIVVSLCPNELDYRSLVVGILAMMLCHVQDNISLLLVLLWQQFHPKTMFSTSIHQVALCGVFQDIFASNASVKDLGLLFQKATPNWIM